MDVPIFLTTISLSDFCVLTFAILFSFWIAQRVTEFFKVQNGTIPPVVGSWIPYFGVWFWHTFKAVSFLKNSRAKYGDIFTIYTAGRYITFVYDKDYVYSFFRAPEDRLSMNKGQKVTGLSLVLDPHDYQTKYADLASKAGPSVMTILRKQFIPRLKGFAPFFQPIIDEYLAQEWTKDTGEKTSRELYKQLVGRMSCRAMIGGNQPETGAIIESEAKLGLQTMLAIVLPSVFWPLIRWKCKSIHAEIDAELMKVIRRRRKLQAKDPENWIEENGFDDLLSAYMQAYPYKEGMTEAERWMADGMALAVKGFIFAAVINTTVFTQVTLLRILDDKKLKAEIEKELDEVLREDGGSLQDTSVKKLRLLNSCFLETMRLATFPSSFRIVDGKPHKVGKYTMPVGSIMAVAPVWQSINEENYKDCHTFVPDRFMDGIAKSDHAYLPFGAGKHFCIGMPMAQMENQLSIAAVLKIFDLEMVLGDKKLSDILVSGYLMKDVKLKYIKRKHPLGH